MEEIKFENVYDEQSDEDQMASPDFSKITEKPKKSSFAKIFKVVLLVLGILLVLVILLAVILGVVYYNNVKQAYNLSYSAKANMELAVHKMVNRDFKEAANLINTANSEFDEAKELLDEVIIVRQIPYVGIQLKAVDELLIAGINLTESGEKVVLLIDDIISPLANESITYANITPQQKKDILNKIVASEDLLYEVQDQIDEASEAIDAIPEEKLVKQLREGIAPLKEYLPQVKRMIDNTLPMLRVIPKVVGFEESKTYLFLLQNNNELRPTGGFIGTYGILKLQDGEIVTFDTDNVYNLDRAPQYIIQEPSPEPIAKYLEQPYVSLRDVNWAPDFPTTAEKAMYMYHEDYRIWQELKESGQPVVGELDIEIIELIPYEPELDGVIAMTPEVMEGLLELTGPIVVEGRMFSADNFQDELEYIVGREYKELDIPISERKEIIKKLADHVILKLMSMPFHKITDVLEVGFDALDEKQVLMYSTDAELQDLILERNWGGEIIQTENDYLMVVDSNLASLKTDQFVEREIEYTLEWQGNDLIANVSITYQNNADFTWRSSRLRSYTRVYVPQGSVLLNHNGAMEDDKVKDPEGTPGEVKVADEFGKTYFGAFISIEPHEIGVLSFEYKLPQRIKDQITNGNYQLLVQKQPGVIHDLTLDLKFDKNIKSATPPEQQSEWFNKDYDYSAPLLKDIMFWIDF